jgi:hypothetical protein
MQRVNSAGLLCVQVDAVVCDICKLNGLQESICALVSCKTAACRKQQRGVGGCSAPGVPPPVIGPVTTAAFCVAARR